eukprot:2725978-Amphidinium_carterae.1
MEIEADQRHVSVILKGLGIDAGPSVKMTAAELEYRFLVMRIAYLSLDRAESRLTSPHAFSDEEAKGWCRVLDPRVCESQRERILRNSRGRSPRIAHGSSPQRPRTGLSSMQVEIHSDSSAARAFAQCAGLGKQKHEAAVDTRAGRAGEDQHPPSRNLRQQSRLANQTTGSNRGGETLRHSEAASAALKLRLQMSQQRWSDLVKLSEPKEECLEVQSIVPTAAICGTEEKLCVFALLWCKTTFRGERLLHSSLAVEYMCYWRQSHDSP